MTEADICNMALGRLGEARITALTDENTAARACSLYYAQTRDEELRAHRWNFCRAQAVVEPAWVALENDKVTNAGGRIKIATASPHGLATGDRVYLRDGQRIPAANGRWQVTVVDGDEFTLDESVHVDPVAAWVTATPYLVGDVVGQGGDIYRCLVAHTSGTFATDLAAVKWVVLADTGEWVRVPLFEWDYRIALPADCLRVWEVQDTEGNAVEHEVQAGWLLVDEAVVRIVYGARVTDVEAFDPLFVGLLVLKVGSRIASTVQNGSTTKGQELLAEYERMAAPLARRIDANEPRPRVWHLSDRSAFVQARGRGV